MVSFRRGKCQFPPCCKNCMWRVELANLHLLTFFSPLSPSVSPPGLLEERALLLGRMGKHEQALFIYVHILKDTHMAEEWVWSTHADCRDCSVKETLVECLSAPWLSRFPYERHKEFLPLPRPRHVSFICALQILSQPLQQFSGRK